MTGAKYINKQQNYLFMKNMFLTNWWGTFYFYCLIAQVVDHTVNMHYGFIASLMYALAYEGVVALIKQHRKRERVMR